MTQTGMCVHVDRKVTSVDKPHTENEKTTKSQTMNSPVQLKKSVTKSKHELSKRTGSTRSLGPEKDHKDIQPPWFEKQSQVMHADLHFMRHPRDDADPQSSTSRQKVSTKQKKQENSCNGCSCRGTRGEKVCALNYKKRLQFVLH